MALRINQNLSAMNAARNLAGTDSALSQSIERLSSGYRINRASDDPAGLVISENLRAQISGLGQAISNSTDAVNMIKTAEAALDEVSSQLVSMRALALHASNVAVNDEVGIGADQAQIRSTLEALDRIAANTQFGTKKLLDGSGGVVGSSTNAEAVVLGGTAGTKGGTYPVEITAVASQAFAVSTPRDIQQVAMAAAPAAASGSAAGITGSDYSLLRFNGALVTGGPIDIRVYSTDTVQDVINRVNNDPVLSRDVKATINPAGALVFQSKYMSNTAGTITVAAVAGSGATGTAANLTAFLSVPVGPSASTSTTASGSALLQNDERLTITDAVNGKSVSVALLEGDSLDSAVAKINAAVQQNGVNVQVRLLDGGKLQWTNTSYGNAANASVTVTSNIGAAYSAGADMGIGAGTLTVSAAGATGSDYTGTAGTNVAGTINGEPATGVGQELTGNSGNANTDGLKVKVTASIATAGVLAQVTIKQGSASFQIGANQGQSVAVSIDSTATSQLGTHATGLQTTAKSLHDIDVTTLEGAQDAIRIIDNAISQISGQRATLGSFQKNSLESNIRSLEIAKENMSASESDIRNADMAVESTNFAKNNILVQAGTAMLSQANQTPQALLQLLK